MNNINLSCVRGDSTAWDAVVTNNGSPVDLTGAKLWMTAVRGAGGARIFQRTSLALGGIVIDPDQVANKGKATVKLDPTSTSSLASEPVTLYYDIQVRTAAGDVWTVSYGDLVVVPDVTTEVS